MSCRKFRVALIGLTLLAGIGSPVLAAKPKVPSQNANQIAINQNQHSGGSRNATTVKWKLDKSRATFTQLTNPEQKNFDIFQNAIASQGMSARDAAARIGSADFKELNKKTGQYQIRLSRANRATFLIDNTTHTVKILQVGGHT